MEGKEEWLRGRWAGGRIFFAGGNADDEISYIGGFQISKKNVLDDFLLFRWTAAYRRYAASGLVYILLLQ